MRYAYSPVRWVLAAAGQDLLLAAMLLALVWFHPRGTLFRVLTLALGATLAWGLVTLHFPRAVEVDDEGIAFFDYGRVHRFAWRDVRRLRVRRFVVRDRVLVRISPSPPFRGRYWLLDGMEARDGEAAGNGFEALVRALERRARLHR